MATKRKNFPSRLEQPPKAKLLIESLRAAGPNYETFAPDTFETLLVDAKRAQEKMLWAADEQDDPARRSATGTMSICNPLIQEAALSGAKYKHKNLKREAHNRNGNVAKWASWQEIVTQKRAAHRHASFSQILIFASRELGVPIGTLKRRVKDPAPTGKRVGAK
jgi:hypothetical protein